mmetsp:Transcript_74767/g.211288  ORF Transcript_74767/g.211288 Transcript_74767/m.211288 type:complete len:208 (-) Transcript_74767:761-1384(-)
MSSLAKQAVRAGTAPALSACCFARGFSWQMLASTMAAVAATSLPLSIMPTRASKPPFAMMGARASSMRPSSTAKFVRMTMACSAASALPRQARCRTRAPHMPTLTMARRLVTFSWKSSSMLSRTSERMFFVPSSTLLTAAAPWKRRQKRFSAKMAWSMVRKSACRSQVGLSGSTRRIEVLPCGCCGWGVKSKNVPSSPAFHQYCSAM